MKPAGHGSSVSGIPELRLVAWETTRRCHLQCKHCRGAARDERYEGELTEGEGKHLIDSIASFAKPILILTGGEPMLREDIYRLARYATDRSIRVVMSPCGHLINDETSALIKKSGIRRISISLDGSNAKTHDAFRGVPGAFDAALRGIGFLREAGVEFQINTTVTKHNSTELQGILDLAKKIGAVVFNPFFLVPTGRGAAIADLELSPAEYEKALLWVHEKSRTEPIEVRPTCAPHFNRIASKSREAAPKPDAQGKPHGHHGVSRGCLGGAEFIFVSHRGRVQPCGFLDLECGDLRASGFDLKKIYETSPQFLAIRNRPGYHGKCGACEYLSVCGGCRARAYETTGDYLDAEPYCVYMPSTCRETRMDAIDKKIVNIIQREFPVVMQPYAVVAENLGITEDEVLSRIESLVQQKIIRKIGASVTPRKMSHTTTLVAASVKPEKLQEVADAVSAYPNVTHNYGREHEFNLWFTLVGRDREEINRLCKEISGLDGVIELMELPATHLFKLDVFFDFCEEAAK